MSANKHTPQEPRYSALPDLKRTAWQIQWWRRGSGYSKRQLSRKSGLPVSAFTRLERPTNDPRLGTLYRAARGLNLTLHQLLNILPPTTGLTPEERLERTTSFPEHP